MPGTHVVRVPEARAVDAFLERLTEGPSGLVVAGDAGIGKTTVLRAAADRAATLGVHVLSAHGAPAEVTYAYAAVGDMLSTVDLSTAMPAVQRAALDRVVEGHGDGPSTDERIVATAFLSAIARLTTTAPVLICIDDVQWLDRSSRTVMGYAARRLRGPVGLLATVRTGDPGRSADTDWLSFALPDALQRIAMQPLTFDGVHTLIRDRLDMTLTRPSIERVYQISKGNPFFALELAKSVAADTSGGSLVLPSGLAALVRSRIGEHDDEVGAVLLAAACAPVATVELVGRATGNSSERVTDLLEPLEMRNIVELVGNRVHFTHPLFATGAYATVSQPRKRAMHRAMAGISDQPEVKARHLALAATTGDEDTLTALDAAADATSARGAQAVAAELVELAIELGGDTAQRRIRAGELHFRAGSLVAARRHLQSTLDDLPAGVMRSLALMWLGGVIAYDDDLTGAVAAFSEAADGTADVPALQVLCLLRLALALAMTDRMGEAIERAEVAIQLADQVGLPGLKSQALSIWVLGKFVWGDGVNHRALETAVELEDPNGGATTYFRARGVQAMILAYTGDLVRADTQMRAVREQMLDNGTEVDLIWAANRIAAIAGWSGRFGDAAQAAREALQRAEQFGGRLSLATAWTTQAAVAAYAGRESEVRVAAAAAIDAARAIGARELIKEPTRILAFLEVSLGNYIAALDVLAPLLEVFDPVHDVEIEEGSHLPNAIEALVSVGRLDEAEPLVLALERGGVDRGRPWMSAVGARARSQLLAARGDVGGAVEAAQRAMTHHGTLTMPFETARTQLLLGQLYRRSRQRSSAATVLHAATDAFDQLGARLWAARSRTELTRTTATRVDDGQLTGAERRIADLAAAGLPNKDIAAELFLSSKTVEATLTRVYRKLGVRSRAGLVTALSERR